MMMPVKRRPFPLLLCLLAAGTLASCGGGGNDFSGDPKVPDGYKPDKLVLKGNAGYTGSLDTNLLLEGDELKDLSKALKEVSLSSSDGIGQGLEVSAELDLTDPDNLAATLQALTSQGQNVVPLALAINEDGKLGFDTYDLATSETEGSIKVGLGVVSRASS